MWLAKLPRPWHLSWRGGGEKTSKTDISTQWTVKSDLRWKRQIAGGGMPTITLFPAHSFSSWTIMPPRKERKKQSKKQNTKKPLCICSHFRFAMNHIPKETCKWRSFFNFHATTIGGWGGGKETGKVAFGKRPRRLVTVMITALSLPKKSEGVND